MFTPEDNLNSAISVVALVMLLIGTMYYATINPPEEETIQPEPEVVIGPEPVTPADEQIVEDVEPDPAYECLALNIYFESRSDNLAGRAAVADVVLNRVDDDFYPDDICSVVKQTVYVENWKGNIVPKRNMCQFSWYCDGLSDDPKDTNSFIEALELAHEVIDEGKWRGITEGSTHYHAPYVRPKWVNDRGMNYIGAVGAHEFYRWER